MRREPELPNTLSPVVFGFITVTVSIITWLLVLGWLLSVEMGGLGPRSDTRVTEAYFNWHPFLMSMAFLVWMIPAVVSYETCPCSRRSNKALHGTFNTIAFVTTCFGLYIVLDCHLNLSSHGVFKSVHACVGYITFSLLGLNYLYGLSVFAFNCVPLRIKQASLPYHKRFGSFIVILGCANILIGLSKYTKLVQMEYGQLISGFVLFTLLGFFFTVPKYVNKVPIVSGGYMPTDTEDQDDEDANQN